jgi:phosphoglycerate-specific signal transduction histidine kinase
VIVGSRSINLWADKGGYIAKDKDRKDRLKLLNHISADLNDTIEGMDWVDHKLMEVVSVVQWLGNNIRNETPLLVKSQFTKNFLRHFLEKK